jgi:hypothetical protein
MRTWKRYEIHCIHSLNKQRAQSSGVVLIDTSNYAYLVGWKENSNEIAIYRGYTVSDAGAGDLTVTLWFCSGYWSPEVTS